MKKYSIKDLVNKIQNKEISCEEVIDFYIKEIEKKEDKIDAFLSLDKENAIKKAKYLDEKIVKGTLQDIAEKVKENNITKTALIMVGEFLGKEYNNSKLYDKDFKHEYRF